eukprot:g3707.t1
MGTTSSTQNNFLEWDELADDQKKEWKDWLDIQPPWAYQKVENLAREMTRWEDLIPSSGSAAGEEALLWNLFAKYEEGPGRIFQCAGLGRGKFGLHTANDRGSFGKTASQWLSEKGMTWLSSKFVRTQLREPLYILDLCSISLTSGDATDLANFLSEVMLSSSLSPMDSMQLKQLLLGSNSLGDLGIRKIIPTLLLSPESKQPSSLTHLDVSNNSITSVGAVDLAKMLVASAKTESFQKRKKQKESSTKSENETNGVENVDLALLPRENYNSRLQKRSAIYRVGQYVGIKSVSIGGQRLPHPDENTTLLARVKFVLPTLPILYGLVFENREVQLLVRSSNLHEEEIRNNGTLNATTDLVGDGDDSYSDVTKTNYVSGNFPKSWAWLQEGALSNVSEDGIEPFGSDEEEEKSYKNEFEDYECIEQQGERQQLLDNTTVEESEKVEIFNYFQNVGHLDSYGNNNVSFSLEILDLSLNKIGDRGAAMLGKALTVNYRLKQLVLKNCDIQNSGASALASGVLQNGKNHGNFCALSLAHNPIGDHGALAVVKAIGSKHSKLTHLDYSGNIINTTVALAIANALRSPIRLRRLKLSSKSTSPQGKLEIQRTMKDNVCAHLFFRLEWEEGESVQMSSMSSNSKRMLCEITEVAVGPGSTDATIVSNQPIPEGIFQVNDTIFLIDENESMLEVGQVSKVSKDSIDLLSGSMCDLPLYDKLAKKDSKLDTLWLQPPSPSEDIELYIGPAPS